MIGLDGSLDFIENIFSMQINERTNHKCANVAVILISNKKVFSNFLNYCVVDRIGWIFGFCI